MQKANQTIAIRRDPPEITDGVREKIAERTNPQHARLTLRKSHTESRIASCANRITETRREIARLYTRVGEAQDSMRENRRLLTQTERELATTAIDYGSVDAQLEQLRHLPWISRISLTSSGKLKIMTNCLFTDIRIDEGSRTKKRRNIGTFRIIADLENVSRTRMKIENTLFPDMKHESDDGGYGHWAVHHSEGVPCLEDHEQGVVGSLRDGDLFGFANALYYFLVSDADGGAYTRTHHFISCRNHLYRKTSYNNENLRKDDTVAIMDSYDNYRAFAYDDAQRFGTIVKKSGDKAVVDLGQQLHRGAPDDTNPVYLTHDMYGTYPTPTCYVFSTSVLHKVTPDVFATKSIEQAKATTADTMTEIDALPHNAPREMAQEIMNR